MSGRLSGHVAFVTVDDASDAGGRHASLARALIAEGALVVLVCSEPEVGGRLATTVGARAVFCPGDDAEADVGALVELTEELLRADRPGPGPAGA